MVADGVRPARLQRLFERPPPAACRTGAGAKLSSPIRGAPEACRERCQSPAGALFARLVHWLVYARHGRELMGWKSPVYESCQCQKH